MEESPNLQYASNRFTSGNLKTKVQTKEKVTGFFLARADGYQMIVFKGACRGKIYREVSQFNNDSLVCVTQKNAWCDGDVMNQWIEKVWKKESEQ